MILCTRFTDGVRSYTDLGRQFQTVFKEVSPERFKETADNFFGENSQEGCYGFIIHHNGADVEPLYKGFENSLMSDSVEIFKDLTLR